MIVEIKFDFYSLSKSFNIILIVIIIVIIIIIAQRMGKTKRLPKTGHRKVVWDVTLVITIACQIVSLLCFNNLNWCYSLKKISHQNINQSESKVLSSDEAS